MRNFCWKTEKPLQFAVCGRLVTADGFLHHRRSFDCHVFILVTEGTLHITTNGEAYDVGPNQYVFLKAGEEHFGHLQSKGALSYYWVHIVPETPVEVSLVAETLNMISEEGCSVASVKPETPDASETKEIAELNRKEMEADAGTAFSYYFPEYGEIFSSRRVQYLFKQLLDLSLEEHLYSPKLLDYTVSLLLMELSQECSTSRSEHRNMPQVVASVREWIKSNYAHPFKITDLAEEFGYQANYLSTLFKRSMGISIIEYTNKIRIEAAKSLLETHGLDAKAVAYSCGFADEKYFMKVFKKLEGVTPGQYLNG